MEDTRSRSSAQRFSSHVHAWSVRRKKKDRPGDRAPFARTKFDKQTFHEYAGLSIGSSRWAKAYYDLQISRGKSAQMAKRALAFKWQRIIHRCWQSREPYNEQRYIERLRANGSPLVAMMAEPS